MLHISAKHHENITMKRFSCGEISPQTCHPIGSEIARDMYWPVNTQASTDLPAFTCLTCFKHGNPVKLRRDDQSFMTKITWSEFPYG